MGTPAAVPLVCLMLVPTCRSDVPSSQALPSTLSWGAQSPQGLSQSSPFRGVLFGLWEFGAFMLLRFAAHPRHDALDSPCMWPRLRAEVTWHRGYGTGLVQVCLGLNPSPASC